MLNCVIQVLSCFSFRCGLEYWWIVEVFMNDYNSVTSCLPQTLNVLQAWSTCICRLFKDYPQYQPFFKAFRNKSLDQLASSPMLRAHGSSVLFQLSSVIDSLDDVECMVEIWKKVLISHVPRGITSMGPYEVRWSNGRPARHFSACPLTLTPDLQASR